MERSKMFLDNVFIVVMCLLYYIFMFMRGKGKVNIWHNHDKNHNNDEKIANPFAVHPSC